MPIVTVIAEPPHDDLAHPFVKGVDGNLFGGHVTAGRRTLQVSLGGVLEYAHCLGTLSFKKEFLD
jgi:hypothetical protein